MELQSVLLKSMTGYAQARVENNGSALRITLRSVNHRFLDVHLRLPEGFEALEPAIRRMLREKLRRGHVDVTLHFDSAKSAAVEINREAAAAYMEAAEALRRQFNVAAEPNVADILRLPGVIGVPATALDENAESLAALVAAGLSEALEKLDRMRRAEGRVLAGELTGHLANITSRTAQIAAFADRVRPAFARRLEARLKELLADAVLDPARLAQEAALAAQRSDISEELARLRSHVLQFENLLMDPAEAGKKLDFLLQEMQREASTMLAKTPGSEGEALEITQLALEVKSEIEKLREQVQNIE
jgi:uncharacterized protein (TIGR00255 family)